MSLYPQIFLVECSVSVPNLMLVSSIAQFPHISAGLKAVKAEIQTHKHLDTMPFNSTADQSENNIRRMSIHQTVINSTD